MLGPKEPPKPINRMCWKWLGDGRVASKCPWHHATEPGRSGEFHPGSWVQQVFCWCSLGILGDEKYPVYRAYFFWISHRGPCWDRGPPSLPFFCFRVQPAWKSVQANYTTIMLRNIPNKYSRQMLIDQLLGFRKQRKRKETLGEVDEK